MKKVVRIISIALIIVLLCAIYVSAYSAYHDGVVSKYVVGSGNDKEKSTAIIQPDGKYSFDKKLKFNTLEQLKKNMPNVQQYHCELVKTYKGFKSDFSTNTDGYERRCYNTDGEKKIKYYSIPDKRQTGAYTLDVEYW